MNKLTCDQIAEIITNDESADELSDFDSSSDESDGEDLAQVIRKQLVSKITNNNISSTTVSNSDVSSTLKNVSNKKPSNDRVDNTLDLGFNNCSNPDDPYLYLSSPEISISNDLNLNSFDIENMEIIFDDNYYVDFPLTSTPNTNTNKITTLNSNSNNCSFDINSVHRNIEQNDVISSPEPTLTAKKRKSANSTKKQIPNKNIRLDDGTLFSGLWNFNENMLPQYCPNNLNIDCSQSGVNNDLINNLPSENWKLYIFKHIFDEKLLKVNIVK